MRLVGILGRRSGRYIIVALAAAWVNGAVTAQAQVTPDQYVVTTLAGASAIGSVDGTRTNARFLQPYGVAVDSGGTIYVADTGNATIRKITPDGVVTTLAGVAGDKLRLDGTLETARFLAPTGIAVDAAGTLYVTDGSAIRKITADAVTTVAGGESGNADGPAIEAQFSSPSGIAVDAAGTLYVADTYNHTIRKITAAGSVTTLAGLSRTPGFADGSGSAARFNWPGGIAVDTQGAIYVADTENHIIRRVTADAAVTTIAGVNTAFGTVDGLGSAARFGSPSGIAVDSTGTLYVADLSFNTLRKITPAGAVTTLAAGDGAGLLQPQGVAVDAAGTVYVADTTNSVIRQITPAAVITAVAGYSASVGLTDGPVGQARFNHPQGLAIDSGGSVYVADTLNHAIRVIAPDGTVRTLARRAFVDPRGLAVDGSGVVYVADTATHVIRTITPDGVVTTLAGLNGSRGSADGVGSAARFNQPTGVAVDNVGTVYVADTGNHTVRAITPGGIVTTLAGTALVVGRFDAQGAAARFSSPTGLAIGADGVLYVADTANHAIRAITRDGRVTTVAGSGVAGASNGVGSAAQFSSPRGVAVTSAGTIYVADTSNDTIRAIDTNGQVTTIAGSAGFIGNTDAAGEAARFFNPAGIAVAGTRTFYVADAMNNAIRRGRTVNLLAPTVTVTGGSFVYDGMSHGASAVASGLLGAPVAGSPALTYAPGGSTAPANVGTYTVTANFHSTNPDYDDASGTGTITITPTVPTLAVTRSTFVYDGAPHGVVAAAVGTQGSSVAGTIVTVYTPGGTSAPIAAGSYSAYVTFTSSDPNYSNVTGVVTLTIMRGATLAPPDHVNQTTALAPAGFWSMGEAGGALADGSGHAIVGIPHGAPTYGLPGPFTDGTTAIQFNGSNSSFTFGDNFGFAGTTSFSFAFWMYRATLPATAYEHVISKQLDGAGNGWFVSLFPQSDPSRGRLSFQRNVGGTNVTINTATALPLNQWNLIVGTYDGARMRLYLNGVQQGTGVATTLPLAAGTNQFTIGKNAQYNAGFFSGRLKDVAVMSGRALAQADVTALYATAPPTTGAPTLIAPPPSAYTSLMALAPSGYWGMGESSGTLGDSSGNTVTGTPHGTPIYGAAGAFSDGTTAIQFNGTNSFFTLGNKFGFAGTTSFSFVFWMYQTAVSATTYEHVVSKQIDGSFNGWFVNLFPQSDPSRGRLSFQRNVGGTNVTVSTIGAVPLNQWNLVVGTYDGARMRLYLNGVQQGTGTPTTLPLASGANPFTIGKNAHYNANFFTGRLQDVAIIPGRAMAPTEVANLYSTVPTGPPPPPSAAANAVLALNPAGYWRMSENNGALSDSSGHAITGTPNGAPSYGVAGPFTDGTTAIQFNGTNSSFSFDDTFSFAGNTAFSFALWMYQTAVPAAGHAHVLSKQIDGAFNGWFVSVFPQSDPSSGRASFQRNVGGTNVTVNTIGVLPLNQWNLLVGTYDGTRMQLYLNGVQQGSGTATSLSLAAGANPLTVGKNAHYNANFFSGRLKDVTIFQGRALTASDVAALWVNAPQ